MREGALGKTPSVRYHLARTGGGVGGAIVGIDLGTTHSLVACVYEGRPVVIPNAAFELLTPSAVHVSEAGELTVGAAAFARRLTDPTRTATSFKRDMGLDTRYSLGTRQLGPVELSALVLGSLKSDAEAFLGGPVSRAVVTVPAWFGERQRRATRDAAAIAGLEVPLLINEPTAAALAYGLAHRGAEVTAVVVDLGGGTFDVTVLEMLEGLVEIRGVAGDARLGGDDFTRALAEDWLASLDLVDPVGRSRVHGAAERAKIGLGASDEVTVALPRLPVRGGPRDVELSMSRSRADELWKPLFDRLRGPLRRALADGGVRTPELVLPVGGGSLVVGFDAVIEELVGKAPLRTLEPALAVAEGAAIQAGRVARDAAVEDFIVTDIAPFTLGVEVSRKTGASHVEGLFEPIIERGTVLPASRECRLYSVHTGQRNVDLRVFQGEHVRTAQNQLLRSLQIPLRPGPAHQELVVRLTYDASGLLEIDVVRSHDGHVSHAVVEGGSSALPPDRIAEIRARLGQLKVHPRDAAANQAALARAEALHPELNGPPRAALAAAVGNFLVAIDGQDPREIAQTRARLTEMVSRLSP